MAIKINGTNTTASPGITGPDTDTGLVYGTDEVQIVTGGTTRATVDSSGNVGIGLTSPQTKFHSSGTTNGAQATFGTSSSGLKISTFQKTGNDAGVILDAQEATNGTFTFSTRGSERMRIDSSGNVGIGTTSPGYKIEVTQGSGNSVARFTGANSANLVLRNATSNVFELNAGGGNDELTFGTGGNNERMRINSSGDVLIGTSSLYGTGVTLRPNATSAFSTSITGGTSAFVVSTGTYDPAMIVRGDGGIANYQGNNVNLSDRNSKKDIVPAADTWDCIKEWEIVKYRYNDQPAESDLNIGVIAQQVAENCPEVITTFEEAKDDQPEKLGVKEQQMYWMAIKALQEAQARIETLEAKVTTLEAG